MLKQCLVLVLLVVCFALQAEPEIHEINAHESLVWQLDKVDEVVITNEGIVGYQQLDQGSIVVTGKQTGTTEILLFTENSLLASHRIRVRAPIDQRLKLELIALQRSFPQLKIHHHDALVSISGQLDVQHQAQVDELLSRHPKLISQIEFIGEQQRAMLVVEVRIAEVKRSFARHLGIRWPAHINGPLIEDVGQWLHLPLSAQSTIDVMEREGQARLLATPTLSAVSGGEADFLVGGEFPVPQVLAQGLQDVSFRPYGIQLRVAPQLLANGQIQTSLVAEMSSIDPATAVNGIPGLLTRKVASTLVVAAGETLILSGLMQHEQAQQADRFPALHNLPVLGALFASKQFRRAETDLLIMVTPKLASDAEDQRARAKNVKQQINAFRRTVGCTGLLEPFFHGGGDHD
ncbi:type II and III secretion system protein family protein [Pseudidiomarina sp. E22-M8]|uniref:type II and III secretion system protein family protein n=1 Tax=Pseudidiomarina sp. E22-M8 TaxID=3424768 RepID=UPI00403C0517